eukprot:GHVP01068853.1.p1 GENE.GHVP01068853.1~~GHVP01068853.1.p1  ORF type:complete len:140 (+),score=31.57 GHVP01068853.1:324-743(+)
MKAKIRATGLRLQTAKSTRAIIRSLKGVENVIANINKKMDLPELQNVLAKCQRQSDVLALTEEMMTGSFESLINLDSVPETSEKAVIQSVMEEASIDLISCLPDPPIDRVGGNYVKEGNQQADVDTLELDLERRVGQLK